MKAKVSEQYTRLLRKLDKFVQAMSGHCSGHCSG